MESVKGRQNITGESFKGQLKRHDRGKSKRTIRWKLPLNKLGDNKEETVWLLQEYLNEYSKWKVTRKQQ